MPNSDVILEDVVYSSRNLHGTVWVIFLNVDLSIGLIKLSAFAKHFQSRFQANKSTRGMCLTENICIMFPTIELTCT
jgi:hypothetical protein